MDTCNLSATELEALSYICSEAETGWRLKAQLLAEGNDRWDGRYTEGECRQEMKKCRALYMRCRYLFDNNGNEADYWDALYSIKPSAAYCADPLVW